MQVYPVSISLIQVVPIFHIKLMSSLAEITSVASFLTKQEVCLLPQILRLMRDLIRLSVLNGNPPDLSRHGSLHRWRCIRAKYVG